MRKIYRIFSVALIFMLIGVLVVQDIAYSQDIFCLRVPVRTIDGRIKDVMLKLAANAVAMPEKAEEYSRTARNFGDRAFEIHETERQRIEKQKLNYFKLHHDIGNLSTGPVLCLFDLVEPGLDTPILSKQLENKIKRIIKYASSAAKSIDLKYSKIEEKNPDEVLEELALIKKVHQDIGALSNDLLQEKVNASRKIDIENIVRVNKYIILILSSFDPDKGIDYTKKSLIKLKDLGETIKGYFKNKTRGYKFDVIISEGCPKEILVSSVGIWLALDNLIRNGLESMEKRQRQESPEEKLLLTVSFDWKGVALINWLLA